MPLNIHPAFLIVLLIIVLIIFGPGKLPELGGAAGRAIREFRKTSNEITEELKNSVAEKEAEKEVEREAAARKEAAAKEPATVASVAAAEPKSDAEKSA
jgi:sec-independent protein translocase protein TatA